MPDDETLLVFPCSFAVKAMGETAADFDELVLQLVSTHVEDPSSLKLSSKPSRAGKYTSVTVSFQATSKNQLDAIYYSLTAHERIKMAL